MCAVGMVCGGTSQFSFWGFFSSELSVKTCCQLWEDSDTPPILSNASRHSSSRPAGNFVIAIPVKWARPTMQSIAATCHCGYLAYWLHCRRQGMERGTPNATRRNILVITIFEMCLNGSLSNPVAVVRPTRSDLHKKLRAQAPSNPCASTYRWCTSNVL